MIYLKDNDLNKIVEIESIFKVPVVISASNIDLLSDLSSKALEKGAKDLILNLKTDSSDIPSLVENHTYIRRLAIENKFKPFGLPVISFLDEIADSSFDEIDRTVLASSLICKYSNILVLDFFDNALIYTLLTLRQNIFTDPQKPLQIEPKVYPVGEVDEYSPVIVTTNFALTYFSITGEIESSGIPCYLLITPSDGMSVLTAWAASKFTGEIIAKALKGSELSNIIKVHKLIIPGYVGHMKNEIEDELQDWDVIVGPSEAVDLPDFLKNLTVKVD